MLIADTDYVRRPSSDDAGRRGHTATIPAGRTRKVQPPVDGYIYALHNGARTMLQPAGECAPTRNARREVHKLSRIRQRDLAD